MMNLTLTKAAPVDQPSTYYDAHVAGEHERRVTAEWSIALDAILARRLGAHVRRRLDALDMYGRRRLAEMEAAKEKK